MSQVQVAKPTDHLISVSIAVHAKRGRHNQPGKAVP